MAYNYENETVASILTNLDQRMNSAEAIAAAAGISEDDFDALLEASSISTGKLFFKADAYQLGLFVPKPLPVPDPHDYLDECPTAMTVDRPVLPTVTANLESGGNPTNSVGTGRDNRNIYSKYMVYDLTSTSTSNIVENVTVSDHELEYCGLLMNFNGNYMNNVTFERIRHLDARFSSHGFGLVKLSNYIDNLTVRDVWWVSNPYRVYDDVEGVINLRGKNSNDVGSGFLFERCFGAWGYSQTGYPNMDGISTEGLYSDGVISNCSFQDFIDAGYDIKGQNWRLDKTVALRCRQSYKIWGASDRHGWVVSVKPTYAHFIMKTNPANDSIGYNQFEKVEAYGELGKPIFQFETYGSDVIITGEILYEEGQVLARSDSSGGRIIMPDGSIITVPSNNTPVVAPWPIPTAA